MGVLTELLLFLHVQIPEVLEVKLAVLPTNQNISFPQFNPVRAPKYSSVKSTLRSVSYIY